MISLLSPLSYILLLGRTYYRYVLCYSLVMARRRNLTAEQQAERKYVMSYISEMYLEAFNEAVKISGAQTRSEYVKSLIVKDLVARGIMETMEIPRKERYLLEM